MRQFNQKYGLIKKGDKIVIAFSGGPDSVYLFLKLLELKEEFDLELIAVHINHGLMKESEEHAEFVKKFCQSHGVKLYYFKKDISAYAKELKLSIEEAGRKFRYEKFYEIKDKHQCASIAVAHHKNDQAETVLYRMSRGTGWKGMAAIRPKQNGIIRPMLNISKKEILAYLGEIGQDYNVDPSNSNTIYARNIIRNCAIPELERVNKQAVSHIAALAQQMEEIGAYLEEQIEVAYQSCAKQEEEMLRIFLPNFVKLPNFMQLEVLKKALVFITKKEKDLTREHIKAMQDLTLRQSGKEIFLPYSVKVIKEYDFLLLEKQGEKKENEEANVGIFLKEGWQEIPFFKARIYVYLGQKNEQFVENRYTKTFDYDKIKQCLNVRTRKQGDYFIINEKGQSKKIKRYFIDEKIPSRVRDEIPLIADGSHILWIPGLRVSKAYEVTKETKHILQLIWENMEEK